MTSLPKPEGWHKEALELRKLRNDDSLAMRAFVNLFEAGEVGKGDDDLLRLALHHLALRFNVCAGTKTLKRAMKSSIEKLSQAAPSIYPPDRVSTAKRSRTVRST